ncbi:type II toxin-antitoxin system Phd/YefM family antitoxin [Leifsonia shinshuensis]|uniref:Type II toxin-antitoxin system prevent-host-death family antitoxin n=1 Tax=Leifsonia shinshuensis TaxID=150026 RepID=A0A7G6Y8Y0_9MICO|nr:type II toxin-antitoxin system prevent-host-death family antitoxin [Leifsonia shinshuensis]QNE34945.1 type II toxin-antitoxin system prevent-host-death family antitoxin [Leifsonia shinshuensis]
MIPTLDDHNITVGQLRQNPTQMLADVQGGERYVVTSHGRPIADVVPHVGSGWVPIDQVAQLLGKSGDEDWARELDEQRAEQDLRDPWQ